MYSGSRGLINELTHECNGYCQSIVFRAKYNAFHYDHPMNIPYSNMNADYTDALGRLVLRSQYNHKIYNGNGQIRACKRCTIYYRDQSLITCKCCRRKLRWY